MSEPELPPGVTFEYDEETQVGTIRMYGTEEALDYVVAALFPRCAFAKKLHSQATELVAEAKKVLDGATTTYGADRPPYGRAEQARWLGFESAIHERN